MKFKIAAYRHAHEKKVQELYQEAGPNGIALYCACSGCSVLAAYSYCKEIDPDNPELTRRIESVKIFYGITEVEE